MTSVATDVEAEVEAESEYEIAWRQVLEPYAQPRLGRSLLDLATSVLPYLALVVAMFFALRVSVVLTLLLAIPASGFLIRTFIVFHDCAHGSFFHSRRANVLLGSALGILVWLPFQRWRYEHAVHHATAGDLDRRGVGDIWTLTVSEYHAGSWSLRLRYRAFRHPVVMFGLGWLLVLMLKPRFFSRSDRSRIRASVIGMNVALVLIVGGLCLALGWETYLLIQLPVLALTGAVGIWLFYVQHQFESTYWETHDTWGYDEAALHGSSFLKLPAPLQFFTGNIGFHHVHHLSARIPNYNLPSAHEVTAEHEPVPALTLRDAFRAARLKLWDDERNRLVTFAEAARSRRAVRLMDAAASNS
jgi:acyl-lipid omega-6 desaturase (Delta-12 desaturase)